MAKKIVAAPAVRAWAKANMDKIAEAGHKCLGDTARGRLHPDVIAAFNRNNKNSKYDPTAKTPRPETLIVRTVVVQNDAGRKYPRKITLTAAEVKELTNYNGHGRIPDAVKMEAAALKAAA